MLIGPDLQRLLGIRLAWQASQHTGDGAVHEELEDLNHAGIFVPADMPATYQDDIVRIVWDTMRLLPEASYEDSVLRILFNAVQVTVLDVLRRLGQPLSIHDRPTQKSAEYATGYIGIAKPLRFDGPVAQGRPHSDDPAVEQMMRLREQCDFLVYNRSGTFESTDVCIEPVVAGEGRRRAIVYEVESTIRREFTTLAYAFLTLDLARTRQDLPSLRLGEAQDRTPTDDVRSALTAIRAAAFRDALTEGDPDNADAFLVDCLGLKKGDRRERAAKREGLWLVLNRSRSWLELQSENVKMFLAKRVCQAADLIRAREWHEDRSFWSRGDEELRSLDFVYLDAVPELVQIVPKQIDDAERFVADLDARRRAGEPALTELRRLLEKATPADRTMMPSLWR